MKNLLLACSFLLIFGSCQNKTTEIDKTQNESTQSDKTERNSDLIKKLTIKNPADYDVEFIKQLRQQPLGHVILDGDLFIESGQEIRFSPYPELHKSIILTGKKDGLTIALTVKRINQTTIDYKVEMVKDGKFSHISKGTASITATFYMGSETDENSQTGMSYGADEYINVKGDCHTYIRLGKEDENGHLLGKLIKNCNDKLKDIDLDDFPTLIEK